MSEPDASGNQWESEADEPPGRPRPLIESILDNLPAWAFVALAISALYLVWATLVIVGKYVGDLPGVAP